MHTVEALSRRLAVGEAVRSIVRNMKTLALASIRQYEEAVQSLDQYARTVELGLQVALRRRDETLPEAAPAPGATGLVAFGSSLGLAGRFNERITSFVRGEVRAAPHRDLRVLALGGYLTRRFAAAGLAVETELPLPTSAAGITACVQDLLEEIEAWRRSGEVTQTILCFNGRDAQTPFTPRAVRLLPLSAEWLRHLRERPWPTRNLPIHTMEWRPLFSALVREHLFVTLYRSFAESLAAEQANRLASMQAAERNIEERLEELELAYRQRRQAAITEELLDLAGGWEALHRAEDEEEETPRHLPDSAGRPLRGPSRR